MGALHEVSIQTPPLPSRIWPQVVRVLRRSSSMLDALKHGMVPRAFDRLIARVAGEAMFPEPRRVTSACTCADPERPCRHILALHELFARQLEDKPWELLTYRGVPLRNLIDQAAKAPDDGDLPPLAFGSREEPVLFPEGQQGELDAPLTDGEIRALLGSAQRSKIEAVSKAIDDYANTVVADADVDASGADASDDVADS